MIKRILLLLGTVVLVVVGAAMFAAFESHIVNIKAHVEKATYTTPDELDLCAPRRLGSRLRPVDDRVDSGHTLAAVEKALPVRWPVIKACKTAVLWWKACSTARPDYYVDYLADNPWIHQPFEVSDTLRPEGLKARLGGA